MQTSTQFQSWAPPNQGFNMNVPFPSLAASLLPAGAGSGMACLAPSDLIATPESPLTGIRPTRGPLPNPVMCETHWGRFRGKPVEVQIDQRRSPITHRAYCDAIVCRGHLGIEVPFSKNVCLVDPLPLCYPSRLEAESFRQQHRSTPALQAQYIRQFAEPDLRLDSSTGAAERHWWLSKAKASLTRRHKEQAARAEAMAAMSLPQTFEQGQPASHAFSQPTMPMGSTTANCQPFGAPLFELQREKTPRKLADNSMPPPPLPTRPSRRGPSAGAQQSVPWPQSGNPFCGGSYAPQQPTGDLPTSDTPVADAEGLSAGDEREQWPSVDGEGQFAADGLWAFQTTASAQLSPSRAEEQMCNPDPVADWDADLSPDMVGQLELLAKYDT